MGTFNTLYTKMACPRCGVIDAILIEMKFGDTNHMTEVKIGDRYPWIPNATQRKGGRPENGTMIGEGYASCDRCQKDWWMRVRIQNDVLVAVELDSEKKGYAD